VARALAALVAASVAILASSCGSTAAPSSANDAGDVLESGSASSTDAGALPADASYTIGEASAASMPGIVEGPPVGGGSDHGSTDVVSLGNGGSIVVSFGPNAIVDGPGPDFIVFENPFWIDGNPSGVYAEPGEVSVSDDGATWQSFPCTPTDDPSASDGTGTEPPYGACAGWHIVYSSPANGISPLAPATAGGDAFDLADLGVKHARYVRIVDMTREACPDAGADEPTANGFDLDAVAIVNAQQP
jgi:hypothetical protein